MELAALFQYPLKSGRPVALTSALMTARGIQDDRRWMLVDEQGKFITARLHPKLLALEIRPHQAGWQLVLPSGESVSLLQSSDQLESVRIWNDQLELPVVNSQVDEPLSDFLGIRCRMVCLPDQIKRQIDQNYARNEDQVSLADGFPVLMTRQASLEALNQQLIRPVPMARFRSNLIIDDDLAAFEEAHWSKIQVGSIIFRVVKPCSRCVMVNTDPQKLKRDEDINVLQSLKSLHVNEKGQACFGMNLIPENRGHIHVNDVVKVLA